MASCVALAWAAGLLAMACGAGGEAPVAELPAASAAPATAAMDDGAGPAALPAIPWEDPEPPGAQTQAEAVVAASWNADKTSRLEMHILPLVDRTSGIQGFATRLAAKETSLDDRLERLGAKVSDTEVRIRLPGSILFDFDRAEIRADAERTLGELAAVLGSYAGRSVRIEGHTDSIASDAYNQALSEKRAAAVKSWLAGHGVDAGRLSTAGYGESKPVADNSTAAGRQLNRRVEVVIARAG